jgi:4'-phosphopantetheinyl transferase EntD
MRQVDDAELVWSLRYHLSRLSASLRAQLASREVEKRRQAELMLATQIARTALGRYEILSDAPLPAGQKTDLFSRAAYGEGGTGAPMIEED